MHTNDVTARGGIAEGVRAVAPLAIAVGAFGISFGVLARAAGFGALAPVVMSATTFGGSAQFAAVSILAAGGSPGAAIAAAVLLNARYVAIGVSVAPAITGPLWLRVLTAQLVVDESWAVAQRDGVPDRGRLIGAGLTLYIAWLSCTALGALGIGELVGDPATYGLDVAFPALFLALLVPQLTNTTRATAALAGAAIALALVPFAPPGVPIVAASVAALLGIRGRR